MCVSLSIILRDFKGPFLNQLSWKVHAATELLALNLRKSRMHVTTLSQRTRQLSSSTCDRLDKSSLTTDPLRPCLLANIGLI